MQADDGFGLDVQRGQIEGYAMMRGLELTEIFVEEGVSGSVPIADRPAGGKLFAQLKKGDAIIAPKLDRLFRSALDALQVFEDLKKRGVSLHLLDLGGDVSGNGVSKVFMTIAASFAELEREKISERTRDAKRYLSSQGVFIGGSRPFGYDIVEDGDVKRLAPNEAEQAVVARMKAMRQAGSTFRDIAAVTGHQPMSVKRILDRVAG